MNYSDRDNGALSSNTFSKPVLEKEICTTRDLYRPKISIALLIQSLDLLWSAEIGHIAILLT